MPNFYNKYPYTDFHELNLDWVLEQVKTNTETVEQNVQDNQQFKENLTQQQEDYEHDMNDWKGDVDQDLTEWKHDTEGDLTLWKTNTENSFQGQIDDMNGDWQQFLDDYQQIGSFMDTFGNNPIVGISQERLTSAITGGEINGINPNNVNTNSENIDIIPENFGLNAGYIDASGSVVTPNSHHYISMKLKNVKLIKIQISQQASHVPLIVLHNSNGYDVPLYADSILIISQSFINIACDGYDTAYINIFNNVTYTCLKYAMNGLFSDKEYFPNYKTYTKTFGKNDLILHYGYYDASFTLVTNTGDSHQHCIIPSKGIRKITVPASSLAPGLPAIFARYSDNSFKLIGNLATSSVTYELDPDDDYDIYLNFFEGVFFDHVDIEYENIQKFNDFINGITTENTSYTAFGDSIGVGYIDPYTIASPNALETAMTILNNSLTNNCVSGSSFVNITGYPCISTQILNATISTPNVLIFGGINDWQLGVSETDLRTAIDTICSYLVSQGKSVIFVTPINHCGRIPINVPKMGVQTITNVIFETAIKYGCSIINGSDFNMPSLVSPAAYKSLLSQDNLHPTQAGYDLIGRSIANAMK